MYDALSLATCVGVQWKQGQKIGSSGGSRSASVAGGRMVKFSRVVIALSAVYGTLA